MSEQPKAKQRLGLDCLGELLVLLGIASILGLPQLQPFAAKMSATPQADGTFVVQNVNAGSWVVIAGVVIGGILVACGIACVAWNQWRKKTQREGDSPRKRR